MLGREGMMLRSATCIAAEDAAPSAPGVSRIARVKPLRSSEERRAGRRAAPEAMTSMSPLPRVLAQFASEPCGSMSMTQTFSFISCAATASDDAIVLFPEPPFWVTNAMVRMTSALAPVSDRDQGQGLMNVQLSRKQLTDCFTMRAVQRFVRICRKSFFRLINWRRAIEVTEGAR